MHHTIQENDRIPFAGRFAMTCLLLALLAGCALHTPQTGSALSGIDGIACVGQINTPPAGLVAADDDALLKSVLGSGGKGMLCAGRVYQATAPVTVYRVWDSSKSNSLYGGWWSFNRPQGPRDSYRTENDICAEWSALDRMSSCSIKPGAKIVVGPGQSATCEHGILPKSAANQVFIPNDSRSNVLFVEDCSQGVIWP
ncbi:MAG: hypothetical protein COS82_11305 [Zetaproteobacteria bacterium CG06_land_8_20_14_3_00_59_53]|nr:MAG: hypothetical protein COX56_04510 [Zetaproteobacteria bacterium CG23_combo_of_CG06-09_8_20_14_all_59_86]PIQ64806.1 MAG: hypothetical protein COV97_06980 [Zetaproteobacteria bacterium CG11_big_fil_rev_8_21_14_0_20_59_439]PIU69570.1 MAG: hypothetical protein COS82_11305 [Zetaproteobacteria bacterium CG06_land_8_20_14_3_00_59_53]PIU96762.1 MAG: hypothetical protein COS62_07095 [Zetaproteobacteria bacterium CG03_land_8_20_14_0_80_59_51]PIY46815.1 MAG: hypothetical protein COZ02_04255 [Zetapr